MMRKSLGLLVLIIILVMAASGCSGSQKESLEPSQAGQKQPETTDDIIYPVTIVDSLDREVTIDTEPQRIISLSPAITEILFAIGVEDKLIGVTDYCDYPAGALEKPKVGSFKSPNLEIIIESEPDVIFVAAGIQADFVKQFEDLGIKVVTLDSESVGQVLNNIDLAGVITGAAAKSLKVVEELEQRMNAVQEKIAQAETKPAVFFEVWDDPLMTAGPGSFINDLIVMAGGENIAHDVSDRFVEFSQEVLVERNPEIYILNNHAHEPQDVKNRPGYDSLKAVQNNRVFTIEDDLVTLPGPRIIQGLEEMAKIIHPELF